MLKGSISMMRYAIVQRNDEYSKEVEKKLRNLLNESLFQEDVKQPELVITIGGDGTFLYALHQYLDDCDKINFIGIHTGTLGFLTEYSSKEIEKFVSDLKNKKPTIISKRLLEFTVDGKEKYYALNEVRVENVMKTQILDVYISNDFLETFRGTGICISSQIGSTAYNRSLNGAVVDNDLEIIQLTEITGIHHRLFQSLQSPLVLATEKEISLKSDNFEGSMLCFDHLYLKADHAKEIKCRLSEKKINIFRLKKYNYAKRLKNLF